MSASTKVEQPTLESWSHQYYQPSDSCQDSDLGQTLELKTGDAGAGPFIIIKTKYWSLDVEEVDKFAQLLKDFIIKNQKL